MAENVVELGDYRFTHKRRHRYPKPECEHKSVELDDNGDVVMCLDCGKQVSAYYALRMLTEHWGDVQSRIAAKQARADGAQEKAIHLLAAREVERAWRDRRHVPVCPHCREGISATDGFGGSSISKEIDNARRARRAALRAGPQRPTGHKEST